MLKAESFTFPETEQKKLIKDMASDAIKRIREIPDFKSQFKMEPEKLIDQILVIGSKYEKEKILFEEASTSLENIINSLIHAKKIEIEGETLSSDIEAERSVEDLAAGLISRLDILYEVRNATGAYNTPIEKEEFTQADVDKKRDLEKKQLIEFVNSIIDDYKKGELTEEQTKTTLIKRDSNYENMIKRALGSKNKKIIKEQDQEELRRKYYEKK